MEHQTEKKHTTVGGIAGIVYQYYVFLYYLLTMKRGEVVSFEKLDDAAKETPNFIALYQAKHSVKYGIDGEDTPLTNRAQDFYRSNIQYFIYKSIILRNLYGVDIMVEATEIAKLRLFLKMVAVVDVDKRDPNLGLDPLPDIDFNIRCDNTLVGYATQKELEAGIAYSDFFTAEEFRNKVTEEMEKVSLTYDVFKTVQLTQAEDMAAFKRAKHDLKMRLATLNDLLNRQMYGSVSSTINYDAWLSSHQPFHWLAEFYEIINDHGGFDVIIGNPPYVVYSERNFEYNVIGYKTRECANLYAFCIERSYTILNSYCRFGMIVPNAVFLQTR